MGMWFTEKLPETPPAIVQQQAPVAAQPVMPVMPMAPAPVPAPVAPVLAPVVRPSLPVVTIPGNVVPALRRLVTIQRGGLHSVIRQIAQQIGWKARFVNGYPMALSGNGLPWTTPVPAYSMLYWIGDLPAISIGADAQTDTITASQKSLTAAPKAKKSWKQGYVRWPAA